MNEILHTKFGTARINNGYWVITSRKEGNNGKKLHRLIYEDYHKCTLLPGAVIHHKDENKLNNRIDNLELMSHEAHLSLHKKGENHHMFGKNHSDEHKQKMSESNNTTGYLNVTKMKNDSCKQGFTWIYQYSENGKRKAISNVSLDKLKARVKAKGLTWLKLNG